MNVRGMSTQALTHVGWKDAPKDSPNRALITLELVRRFQRWMIGFKHYERLMARAA